jgi:hypothetical protein
VTDAQHHRTEERETAKRLVEKGVLEIPSSGVFSRADAQLLTIFDHPSNLYHYAAFFFSPSCSKASAKTAPKIFKK